MRKTKIFAIIGALLVAVILFAGLTLLDKNENTTVDVVVAVSDVPRDTVLTAEVLEIKAVPEELVVGGSYTSVDDLVGKVAGDDIKAGEQVLSSRIREIGNTEGSNLAMLVEKGKRAVAIPVDNITGLGNMIHPGDKVDVIAHIKDNDEMVSRTVVTNVPVLAVDSVMSKSGKAEQYAGITLMVTPKEANKLDWAANSGLLRVTLRTPLDKDKSKVNEIDSGDIGVYKED